MIGLDKVKYPFFLYFQFQILFGSLLMEANDVSVLAPFFPSLHHLVTAVSRGCARIDVPFD